MRLGATRWPVRRTEIDELQGASGRNRRFADVRCPCPDTLSTTPTQCGALRLSQRRTAARRTGGKPPVVASALACAAEGCARWQPDLALRQTPVVCATE
jgi:hypothetical protein